MSNIVLVQSHPEYAGGGACPLLSKGFWDKSAALEPVAEPIAARI